MSTTALHRYGPWGALAVVVAVVMGVLAWPTDGHDRAERVHALATDLRCPECQGLSVADSNTPTSKAMRADIERRVARGESDAAIRQAFVDKYGEDILLSPRGSGLGLLLWVLPVVVLALGGAGIWFALSRGRRQPRLHPTAAEATLVDRARAGRTDA